MTSVFETVLSETVFGPSPRKGAFDALNKGVWVRLQKSEVKLLWEGVQWGMEWLELPFFGL